jgi:hypothetical protein
VFIYWSVVELGCFLRLLYIIFFGIFYSSEKLMWAI